MAYPGSLLTCGALIYASGQLKSGNRETFQRALRWRVIFQTLTVAAAAASLFFFKPPTAQVPPPNADGSPAPMPYWNKEKEERRAAEHDLEWRRRFQDAHARDERENAAVQRMVQEEIEAREKAATAPPEEPPKRVFPKLGQDKRSFTFQQ